MNMSLGQRIREFRKLRGITQERLAELCNVSIPSISRWENDTLHPKMDNITSLAKALNVDEADFFASSNSTLPKNLIIRELTKLFEEMDESELAYFLDMVHGYLHLKSHNEM